MVMFSAAVLGLVVIGSSSAHAQNALDRDLAQMLEWFAGEFDNNQQVFVENETNTPAAERHERIHSIFTKVDLPAFGPHVFYVQQYQDNDPAKIYRQRLYTFSPDVAAGAIVLRIMSFPDDKAVLDAHQDPAKLKAITPQAMRNLPGCEVYWKREGEAFIGSMRLGACRVTSRASGQAITIMDDLRLTANEIWISDRATDDAGTLVFGHPKSVHHKLTRARRYTCYTTIRKDGAAPATASPNDYFIFRNMTLHDQGQLQPLQPEGAPHKYTIELAELTYASSQTRVLKLAVYEVGNDRAVSYAWSSPGALRLGLNLRTIEVGCTLAK
jgi:hypothetical protein